MMGFANAKDDAIDWVNRLIVCLTTASTPSPMLGLMKPAQLTALNHNMIMKDLTPASKQQT
jgi:hypothetical protein